MESESMSSTMYVVEMVIEGKLALARRRPDWDGTWFTRTMANAKTWKTRRGAQRWLDGHPGIERLNIAFVREVRECMAADERASV